MMSDESKEVFVSREELYEMVWLTPTQQIAKDFEISDVPIANICKKLGVPKPPRGYWARLSAGGVGRPGNKATSSGAAVKTSSTSGVKSVLASDDCYLQELNRIPAPVELNTAVPTNAECKNLRRSITETSIPAG